MSASTSEPANTLQPPLVQGYETLSRDQAVPFTQYVRYVLPLDGFVFWLRTQQITITGSLHVAIDEHQNEDETIDINRVVFTTKQNVDVFNDIGPNTIWVGETAGIRFAFSRRGFFFENAGLYHYDGDAVYPVMESQLVDVGSQLDPAALVVSNSLPAWLAVKNYNPIWLDPPNPGITLYPSYAVPDNLQPPYGSVHIEPAGTLGLQSVPLLERSATHYQLATDRVRVTLYGLTNSQAQDWFDTVNRYSLDTSAFGMMSTAAILRDGKRPQVGLNILAMQKIIDFEVAYNQVAVRDTALQLIESAKATVFAREITYASVST